MRFQLSDYGATFATRSSGRRVLHVLLEFVQEHQCQHVTIDFTDVKIATVSFVDEFVGELFSRSEGKTLPFTFEVVHMTSATERAMQLSYRNRQSILRAA